MLPACVNREKGKILYCSHLPFEEQKAVDEYVYLEYHRLNFSLSWMYRVAGVVSCTKNGRKHVTVMPSS